MKSIEGWYETPAHGAKPSFRAPQAKKYESGELQPTAAEKEAIKKDPRAEPRIRGNVIDRAVKEAIRNDPDLEGLKLSRQGVKEPDIYDPDTKRWWDMTTPEPGEWEAHVEKYTDEFGKGLPLFTRPPKTP
jgi:hypothetical protein